MDANIEIAKLAFPFVMLIVGGLVLFGLVKGARNFLHIQKSYVPMMLIFFTIPSVVFLGIVGVLSKDAIVAILGSIVGYSLGAVGSGLSNGRNEDQ